MWNKIKNFFYDLIIYIQVGLVILLGAWLVYIEASGNWGSGLIDTVFKFFSCEMENQVYLNLFCSG